jgi:azurin
MDRYRLFALTTVLGVSFAAAVPAFAQGAAKPAAAAPTAAPAAAASCKLALAGNDLMQFDKKELRVAASCKEIEITLKHSGKLPLAAMGHNVVVTKTADAQAVSNAGIAAGLKNGHVPPGDKRVIAASKLIGGGETTTVKIPGSALPKGGDYTFFCSFPGHFGIMKGKLIVQ